MLNGRLENTARVRLFRASALAIIATALAITSLGCCSCEIIAPSPATHSMAFGATKVGCPDDCKCVCPVPDNLNVAQGDRIQFANTSDYEITIEAPTGSLYPDDKVVVPAGGFSLVTVRDDAPAGNFDLDVTVSSPGMACPGTARPGFIIHPPASTN